MVAGIGHQAGNFGGKIADARVRAPGKLCSEIDWPASSPDHGERGLNAFVPLDVVVPGLAHQQIYGEDKRVGHSGRGCCRRRRLLRQPALEQEEASGHGCEERA